MSALVDQVAMDIIAWFDKNRGTSISELADKLKRALEILEFEVAKSAANEDPDVRTQVYAVGLMTMLRRAGVERITVGLGEARAFNRFKIMWRGLPADKAIEIAVCDVTPGEPEENRVRAAGDEDTVH